MLGTDATPRPSSSTPSWRGSTSSRWRCRRGRAALARIWAASWPKLLAIALVLFVWQVARLERLEARVRAARRRPTSSTRCGDDFSDIMSRPPRTTLERGRPGLRARAGDRHRASAPLVARNRVLRAAHRLADHRAADDAVDRVVPARDPALRAERGRDLLRRRARRGAVDRQRPHQRHRPHPADPAARRARARRRGGAPRSATSSCRRRCRRSSAGSSRAGRSRGAACWPASCSCRSRGKSRWVSSSTSNRAVRRLGRLIAVMIVILVIGILIDALFFGTVERWIRRRYGLVDEATAVAAAPRLPSHVRERGRVADARRVVATIGAARQRAVPARARDVGGSDRRSL